MLAQPLRSRPRHGCRARSSYSKTHGVLFEAFCLGMVVSGKAVARPTYSMSVLLGWPQLGGQGLNVCFVPKAGFAKAATCAMPSLMRAAANVSFPPLVSKPNFRYGLGAAARHNLYQRPHSANNNHSSRLQRTAAPRPFCGMLQAARMSGFLSFQDQLEPKWKSSGACGGITLVGQRQ